MIILFDFSDIQFRCVPRAPAVIDEHIGPGPPATGVPQSRPDIIHSFFFFVVIVVVVAFHLVVVCTAAVCNSCTQRIRFTIRASRQVSDRIHLAGMLLIRYISSIGSTPP